MLLLCGHDELVDRMRCGVFSNERLARSFGGLKCAGDAVSSRPAGGHDEDEPELQSNKTALMNYRTVRNDGAGEPDGAEFWLGQYNEVLIDKAQYVSNLPFSVAAFFHVEGGDDAEGCSCIRQARAAMIARYGSDAQHALLLKHTPGANTAFVSSACAAEQQSEQQGCVSIMPGVDSEWCATTCATSSCPENICKNCPKTDPAKAQTGSFVEEIARSRGSARLSDRQMT